MSDNTKPPLPTVAKLRADIQHHRDWWTSCGAGTPDESDEDPLAGARRAQPHLLCSGDPP
jgi:hypothetical protein